MLRGDSHSLVLLHAHAHHDRHAVVDTFGSDYDTVLEIFHGSPDDLYSYYDYYECSDDDGGSAQSSLVLWGTPGETIYILVGSGNGSPGGNLVVNVNRVTPPVVTVSVVEPAQFNPANGAAHVRFRIESSAPISVIFALATIILETAVEGALRPCGGFVTRCWV